MAFSVTLKNLGAFAAASNLQLFLRKTSDNSLLNAGGDTGSDTSSIGSFTWAIAEDRPAEQMLARIYEGSTETAANIVIDSVLNVGFTEIGEAAAELDSPTATKINEIKTQTDQLAFDEEVGTLDVNVKHYRGTLQSNGDVPQKLDSIKSTVDGIQTDVDGNTGYLTSLTSSMTTLLGRVTAPVYGMWTDLIQMITGTGTANAQFTTKALENGPSGGAGGGQAPTIVTLQSVAGISPGVIVGPSEPLVIGDDYLTSLGRSIRVNLLDQNGDPAEVVFGDKSLADSGISIQLLLAKSGKPTTIADLVGTCSFFPAEEVEGVEVPPYLLVEFTKTETAKAIPGPYDMQAEALWLDGKVVTFAPYGQVEFVRNIRRA